MLKKDIVVGKVYRTAQPGVRLRVEEIIENDQQKWKGRFSDTTHTVRANTRYRCTNMKTMRENIVKGAAKFVAEAIGGY